MLIINNIQGFYFLLTTGLLLVVLSDRYISVGVIMLHQTFMTADRLSVFFLIVYSDFFGEKIVAQYIILYVHF